MRRGRGRGDIGTSTAHYHFGLPPRCLQRQLSPPGFEGKAQLGEGPSNIMLALVWLSNGLLRLENWDWDYCLLVAVGDFHPQGLFSTRRVSGHLAILRKGSTRRVYRRPATICCRMTYNDGSRWASLWAVQVNRSLTTRFPSGQMFPITNHVSLIKDRGRLMHCRILCS